MSTQNPYSPPVADSSTPGVVEPDRGRLRKIASAQRQTNLAVLLYLLMLPLNIGISAVAEDSPWATALFGLFALGVLVYGAVAVYRLASVFRGKIVAVLYVLGLLVPVLGLVLLLTLSSKATTILQEHGIKVGLLGANPAMV